MFSWLHPRLREDKPAVLCFHVFPFFLFCSSFLLSKADCSVFAQLTTGRDLAFNYSFFSFFFFFYHSIPFSNIWMFSILCCIPSVTPYISRTEIAAVTSGSKSVRSFRSFPNGRMNNGILSYVPSWHLNVYTFNNARCEAGILLSYAIHEDN